MIFSKIEWTQSTWNPLTGCTKISPGCANCYAERMARRLKAMGNSNYRNGFKLTTHEHILELPLKWKKPRYIFVNSMSDLFHEDVPFDFIKDVFKVMNNARHHIFQVLTKRSRRLGELASRLEWSKNIWMGVSVENADYTYRIRHLADTGAYLKFISFEPLIGRVADADLSMVDWVIVGGESGPGARPILKEWVIEIRDQCIENNIPFFFKQWGGINKKKAGRKLDGRFWNEMPGKPRYPVVAV